MVVEEGRLWVTFVSLAATHTQPGGPAGACTRGPPAGVPQLPMQAEVVVVVEKELWRSAAAAAAWPESGRPATAASGEGVAARKENGTNRWMIGRAGRWLWTVMRLHCVARLHACVGFCGLGAGSTGLHRAGVNAGRRAGQKTKKHQASRPSCYAAAGPGGVAQFPTCHASALWHHTRRLLKRLPMSAPRLAVAEGDSVIMDVNGEKQSFVRIKAGR